MPNPKRRHSRARRGKRRAHHHVTPGAESLCLACGALKVPHRVCGECGKYRGRQVIEVDND